MPKAMIVRRQIHFYALREDIEKVLDAVERKCPLKYIPFGVSALQINEYKYAHNLPHLGFATADSGFNSASYLITEAEIPILVRNITDMDYRIDQLINPDTIVFTPSGLRGTDMILSGRVATVSNSTVAQKLMNHFYSAFKTRFTRVKAYFVGPQAIEFLTSGKRLAISVQSPSHLDLKLDSQA